jgi:hypothetical protein
MQRYPASILLPAQGALAILALAAITLWPPAVGEMLLVPLAQQDANAVARMALASGALLLGPGPLPGSLVVIGRRSRIVQRIEHWDVVITAAPTAGCRTSTADKA